MPISPIYAATKALLVNLVCTQSSLYGKNGLTHVKFICMAAKREHLTTLNDK
jgi:hypothetical protein